MMNLHKEHIPLDKGSLRKYLSNEYYKATGKVANANALRDAIAMLSGAAIHDGETHPVKLRVAKLPGRVYLDLGNENWQVVEIDADGWRVVKDSPVRFRRPKGMLSLPVPTRGRPAVEILQEVLNLKSEGEARLLTGWLVNALMEDGPFPVVEIFGEAGSAKSTATRVLKRTLDPSLAELRKAPNELRDLVVAANNCWIVVFDNVSSIPIWMSDFLCQLATGGGLSVRQLYTDDDETIFDAKRPAVINGITNLAERGDLLSRTIRLGLPYIDDSQRRTEEDFFADFDRLHPELLGGILDALSGALRELPNVTVKQLPRMGDFAKTGIAIETALKWPKGSFMDDYSANRDGGNDVALQASFISEPLIEFITKETTWTGTMTMLKAHLVGRITDDDKNQRAWKELKPSNLGKELRRIQPNLRQEGIMIELNSGGKRREVTISLGDSGDSGDGKSSAPTPQPQLTDFGNS